MTTWRKIKPSRGGTACDDCGKVGTIRSVVDPKGGFKVVCNDCFRREGYVLKKDFKKGKRIETPVVVEETEEFRKFESPRRPLEAT